MTPMVIRWAYVLRHDPTAMLEIVFGLWAALWGVLLLLPWPVLVPPTWAIISHLPWPEWVGGLWFVGLGLTQALEVPRLGVRRLVVGALLATWLFLSIAVALAVPTSTAMVIYPVFVLVQAVLYVRLARYR